MKISKVLIVDDSKLARLTPTRLLTKKGIEVIEAESVEQAMNRLPDIDVDAVFWDVMMPKQDGFEGLRLMREDKRFKHLPCSMYSGDLSMEAQKRAMDNGAQAYLFKPAGEAGLETVLTTLSNSLSDVKSKTMVTSEPTDMQVSEGADGTGLDKVDYKKTIMLLENRTKNLARIVMMERKGNENAKKVMEAKIEALFQEIQSFETQKSSQSHQEREHKRIENDLRGQLKNTRDSLKWVGSIAVASIVIALVGLFVLFFIK